MLCQTTLDISGTVLCSPSFFFILMLVLSIAVVSVATKTMTGQPRNHGPRTAHIPEGRASITYLVIGPFPGSPLDQWMVMAEPYLEIKGSPGGPGAPGNQAKIHY